MDENIKSEGQGQLQGHQIKNLEKNGIFTCIYNSIWVDK